MSGTVVFEDAKLQAVELIAETVTLNNFSVSTATTFQQTTNASNVTTNTLRFTNPTTAFVTTGNVEVGTANLFVDTTTGRVGIGSASPGTKLHIKGSSGELFRYTDGTRTVYGGCDANDPWFGTSTNHDLRLVTNGTSRMTIDSSGNVGIGLTGPQGKLHIYGSDNPLMLQSQRSPYPTLSYDFSGSNAENFQFYDHHGSGRGFLYGRKYTTGTTLNSNAGWQFYGNDNTLALRINGSGNVGIGTVSPGTKLHIKGSSGELFRYTDGTRTVYGGCDANDPWFGTSTNHDLRLVTNGTSRMTIDSSGNVGIGMSNPYCALDVAGSINNGTYAVSNGKMANRSLTIGDHAANYGGGTGGWSTNTAGFMMECLDTTEIAVHDAGTRCASFMYFEGGSTNRFTIGRNMGWGAISTVSINGYIGIGTSTPSYKLHIVDGNNSITYYGPNSSWSSYLAVGSGTDKTVANNTAIAQCITTNGNLHLDAGHTRHIYMNNYSGYYIHHNGLGVWSDDRLKIEEELITNATDTLLKLSPQKYVKKRSLREDENREPIIETGLIAQDIWYDAPELRHIVVLGDDADPTENKPEAPVDGDIQQDPDYSSWGPNAASVSYDGLIAYLIKSNQELHGEIQALKARITSLENA